MSSTWLLTRPMLRASAADNARTPIEWSPSLSLWYPAVRESAPRRPLGYQLARVHRRRRCLQVIGPLVVPARLSFTFLGMTSTRSVLSSSRATVIITVRPASMGISSTNTVPPFCLESRKASGSLVPALVSHHIAQLRTWLTSARRNPPKSIRTTPASFASTSATDMSWRSRGSGGLVVCGWMGAGYRCRSSSLAL